MEKLTVKKLLADGYVYDCELGGNAWYKKGNIYVIWCIAHNKYLQTFEWNGSKFKVL